MVNNSCFSFTIYRSHPSIASYCKEYYKKVMRIIRLFAATMFIAVIAAIPAFAQQRGGGAPPSAAPATGGPVPASKLAFVNTQAFGDEKAGIGRYIAAAKNLDREFAPRVAELQALQNKLKALVEEINKLNAAGGASGVVSTKTLDDKRDEGERLQREFEYKKKEFDAAYAKRYEDVVGPISNDIGTALTAFAKARGITLVLDMSKPAMYETILFGDPALDITTEFVADYNSKNPATASTAAPGR
jgi:Skp family chaperone for outer membrane proteins